jgi:hypothetical protein
MLATYLQCHSLEVQTAITVNMSNPVRYSRICLDRLRGRKAVPWLRRLVAGLSPRRPGFEPRPVHVVDKVALGQVFPRVLRFSPVGFNPPVLRYKEKRKKLVIFITGLHNKP